MDIISKQVIEGCGARLRLELQALPGPMISILATLKEELPSALDYHNVGHTLDVLEQALCLADLAQLSERERELLVVAAIYHDAGFLRQNALNEPIGAELAAEAMITTGGYTKHEIKIVKHMILDTTLLMNDCAQISNTELSPYLLDADLSNLGRECFWEQTKAVASEAGIAFCDFLPISLGLMQRHSWQSDVGYQLYEQQKQQNIADLKLRLNQWLLGDPASNSQMSIEFGGLVSDINVEGNH